MLKENEKFIQFEEKIETDEVCLDQNVNIAMGPMLVSINVHNIK